MGVSQVLKSAYFEYSRVGTPLFVAPEIVLKESYNEKADVWGLGCAIYYLATFEAPFNSPNA
jgi:NIMA (never in mitosis gene a)-related kinase